METSIPCKVYIKSHSLEKVSPRSTQDRLTVGASSVWFFHLSSRSQGNWGLFPAFAETREGWGWGTPEF